MNSPNLSLCAIQSVCDYIELFPLSPLVIGNATGCSSTEEITTACNTIIPRLSQVPSTIELYPNPTTGLLEVRGISYAYFKIINTVGQTLLHGALQGDTTLDLSAFPKGIYFIHISSEEEPIRVRKVVKQ